MASTDLLDYNQIIEQSPSTGDSVPPSGGLLSWNFRCDPNLSWDPSQSFFAMEVEAKTLTTTLTVASDAAPSISGISEAAYNPGPQDFYSCFPLRCFSSMSHIVDGVTIANSNQPHADKIMQEKYLAESTLSNSSNMEAIASARMIDDGDKYKNLFRFDVVDVASGAVADSSLVALDTVHAIRHRADGETTVANTSKSTRTVIFQPPFDFWTKHQRCSGGNHQLQLNLRSRDATTFWGRYTSPQAVALASGTAGVDGTVGMHELLNKAYTAGTHTVPIGVKLDIKNIRLMRRMVRYTIERPISVQEFNVTEMQFFHGQSSTESQTQNFLLPSSTFGLAFYWRSATDSQYSPYLQYPPIALASADGSDFTADDSKQFDLNEFYFTYGGETYPSQRIAGIKQSVTGRAYGFEKLQLIAHQLQGVYNTDMERFNASYGGYGALNRVDSNMFFFPVAKHNNSDNSDLQVTWSGAADSAVSLVVVAFYDARVELSYNSMNQLEKVTKTEWR
jgi:hypothetical protein